MNHKDIIKHIESNNFIELLNGYDDVFNDLEQMRGELRQALYTDKFLVEVAINKATGLYGAVSIPNEIIEEYIETIGGKHHIDNNESKDTATLSKSKKAVATADIRKVGAIFRAYTKSAEKFILTLQSILKSIEKQHQNVKYE